MSIVEMVNVWSSWEATILSLSAGCDTLPIPMNLAGWNIIVCSVCSLCHLQPTTNHILTGRSTTLDQERYTWHHDSVLQVFVWGLQWNLHPFLNFMLISLVTWLLLALQALFHLAFYHSWVGLIYIVLISNDFIILLGCCTVINGILVD